MRTILSIHDLMPDTFKRVLNIISKLTDAGVPADKVYLLVVPGLNWKTEQINTLKSLQQDGFQLAGHGWHHHIHKKTSLFHYLHSAFISRNVAEHLSLSSAEISDMIEMNYGWFLENGMSAPELYVPPAWAMGCIRRSELIKLPFRYYEYSSGLLDVEENSFKSLALTGYEADRLWRMPVLWGWNQLNTRLLSRNRPLRISIHPYDFEYYLSSFIIDHIRLSDQHLSCADIFA
ncbi:DUF2334 domain-containing protein [Gynuella sp.]|uniref:DUF2334 domain-containing protein n=1 Tax=Gynuella sp. TaxID=2969146 RepID=UPI003D14897F